MCRWGCCSAPSAARRPGYWLTEEMLHGDAACEAPGEGILAATYDFDAAVKTY